MARNFLSFFRGKSGSTTRPDVEPQIGNTAVVDSEKRSESSDVVGTSENFGGWAIKNIQDPMFGYSQSQVISFDKEKKFISRDKALQLSVVYSCIDRISAGIATMPLRIMQVKGDEEIEVDSHPAKFVTEKSPNDWQTQFTLMRQFMVDALNGNGYIWIIRNLSSGKFKELVYCDKNSVSLVNLGNRRWVYNYTDEDGGFHVIQPYDMIHLRALGNKGRSGLSPIQLHAAAIRMGMDMQEYGGNFFSSGGKPSGIVGVKGQLDPSAWGKLIDNWNKGAREAATSKNRVIFQPADVTYTPISLSPIDANLVLSMNMTRDEICGIFNVPAYMVGNLANTSYANITAMATAFIKNTLMPWIVNIEQEMTKKIFFQDEIIDGYCVKFDMQAALKGTPVEMLALLTGASTAGFITRNEGRVGIGYPRDNTDESMNKFTVNVSQSKLTDNNNSQTGNQNESGSQTSGNAETTTS